YQNRQKHNYFFYIKIIFFLCYSRKDQEKVEKLYHRLSSQNFDIWFDKRKLLPGQDWEIMIERAVRSSDIIIVCLSNESITKSGYAQEEMRYALKIANQQPEHKIFLIPLRLDECNVPDPFRRWHYVDYYESNGHSRLLKSLYYALEHIDINDYLESY
ncbi:Toll-Interleukin receptor domain protein, partial [Candidatus Magnetomorum sp. HK-1]